MDMIYYFRIHIVFYIPEILSVFSSHFIWANTCFDDKFNKHCTNIYKYDEL